MKKSLPIIGFAAATLLVGSVFTFARGGSGQVSNNGPILVNLVDSSGTNLGAYYEMGIPRVGEYVTEWQGTNFNNYARQVKGVIHVSFTQRNQHAMVLVGPKQPLPFWPGQASGI